MASVITHFAVGAALALPALEIPALRRVLPGWGIPLSAGFLAVFPDFDTFFMRLFNIPYGNFFGHRGFFHSPFFLLLLSAALAAMLAARHSKAAVAWLAVTWAVCATTHPLLDALTDGGEGVMLLFPFSEARLFFPWRPIHVSPISISRFFNKAGYILRSELPFCIVAIGTGLAANRLLAARRPKSNVKI